MNDKILNMRPTLQDSERLALAIEAVLDLAEETGAPLIVCSIDESGKSSVTDASSAAYEFDAWALGALERAKEEIKYPDLVTFEPEAPQGA